MCAYERKSWLPNEDDVIRRLVASNENREINEKLTWNQIANHLRLQLPNSHRTGKQCRQRWHNQLDPNIKKYEEWNEEEIEKLFQLQNQMGNKWSKIAQHLSGRTDNNVKNYFYSSLRRAVRKLNDYVSLYKKKTNMKPFQLTLLTKILAISDEKSRQKLDIKAQKALILATQIKKMLTTLSKEDDNAEMTAENQRFKQNLIQNIQEFNRNCKKKKSKKVEIVEEIDISEIRPRQIASFQEEEIQEQSEKEQKRITDPMIGSSDKTTIIFKIPEEKDEKKNEEFQKKKNYLDREELDNLQMKKKDSNIFNFRSSQYSNPGDDNPFNREMVGIGFFSFGGEDQRIRINPMIDSLDMSKSFPDLNNGTAMDGSMGDSLIFKKGNSKKQ